MVNKVSFVLLILSGILLCLAITYCDILSKTENYSFSTREEYDNVTDGLAFLKKLPIQFNIVNKYFSSFSNLESQDKEKIVMAYAIKNNIGLVNCDDSGNSKCISRYFLENNNNLNVPFNGNILFSKDDISVYIDGYGTYTAKYIENKDCYKIYINELENRNVLYSSFYKYYKKGDIYVFYVFQGYHLGKCDAGNKLYLYDFMDKNKSFEGICDDNNYFSSEPDINTLDFQLYKYELKKDSYGNFYLYGYNPVNKYSI